jgi:serine/threonine-protein kinase
MYETPSPMTSHRADIPAELQAVVLRCLRKDPSERYADMLALETALAECNNISRWNEEEAANWWRSVS